MDIGLSTSYDITSNYFDKSKKNKEELEETQEDSKLNKKLTPDEERLVLDLQSRDAEVKAHESAHQSGGASTGAATYTYQQGPDGKMYAIGGEVSVSFQTGSTPQETIANAQAVIASATAPSDPSGQDMAVASSAMVMMMKAKQQISQEVQEKISGQETYKDESNNSDKSNDKSQQLDIPA